LANTLGFVDEPEVWYGGAALTRTPANVASLYRCEEILSWGPITELDPLRLSFQIQVIRILLRIGLKAVLDGTLARGAARDRDRERILADLTRREFGARDEA
jgi:hypothetical protein